MFHHNLINLTYDLNSFRRIEGSGGSEIKLYLPMLSVGFLLQERNDQTYILKIGVNNKESSDEMSVVDYDDEGRFTYGFIIPDYIGIVGELYLLSYGLMGNTSITSAITVQPNYFDVATLNFPTAAFNIPLLSGINTSDANVDIAGVDIEYGKEVEITTNGTQIIQPNVGYEGMGELTIVTNVPGGGIDVQSDKTQTVTSNGNVTITPDSGYEAMDSVDLTVAVPQPPMNPNKTVTYTANGSYRLDPEDSTYTNAVAMRKATVDVSVTPVISNTTYPGSITVSSPTTSTTTITPYIDAITKQVRPCLLSVTPNLKSFTITSNGSYPVSSLGSEGYCGYGELTVNVPSNIPIEITALTTGGTPTGRIDFGTDAMIANSTPTVIGVSAGSSVVVINETSTYYEIAVYQNDTSTYWQPTINETYYLIQQNIRAHDLMLHGPGGGYVMEGALRMAVDGINGCKLKIPKTYYNINITSTPLP